MQAYSDFQKQAELGGAGDYFQRREEQGALQDERALRAGFHKTYPDAWSLDPTTGRRTIDLYKVPTAVKNGYTRQLHDINKKWNGNLFGQGETTGVDLARLNVMGFKMLPKASPKSVQELYNNQMQGDWLRERIRMGKANPADNPESIDSAMSKRWGRSWMTRPRPQPVPTTSMANTSASMKPSVSKQLNQGNTMKKTQSYNEFLQKNAGAGADILAMAAPGVATAGTLYWLTGLVPWLKRHRGIRATLAGAGGIGTSLAMGKYIGNKNYDIASTQVERDNLRGSVQGLERELEDERTQGIAANNALNRVRHILNPMMDPNDPSQDYKFIKDVTIDDPTVIQRLSRAREAYRDYEDKYWNK